MSAQLCSPPAAIAVTPLLRPMTSTGKKRLLVVPSPSWPTKPPPQHLTPPTLVSAQLWKSPAAIAVTPLLRPKTATGSNRLMVVPSPSWPELLLPQHVTPSVLFSAQV